MPIFCPCLLVVQLLLPEPLPRELNPAADFLIEFYEREFKDLPFRLPAGIKTDAEIIAWFLCQKFQAVGGQKGSHLEIFERYRHKDYLFLTIQIERKKQKRADPANLQRAFIVNLKQRTYVPRVLRGEL